VSVAFYDMYCDPYQRDPMLLDPSCHVLNIVQHVCNKPILAFTFILKWNIFTKFLLNVMYMIIKDDDIVLGNFSGCCNKRLSK